MKHSTLCAQDLAAVGEDDWRALVSYLNLPPVGGYDDDSRSIALESGEAFELDGGIRGVLEQRRSRLGGRFSSPKDLLGIGGFGPGELREIERRLSDWTRYGNLLKPVWGGPEGLKEFYSLLEGAERYIHISTYIIGGSAGLRLARLLARKVSQGVEVRVLFCASGFVISGSPSGTGFVSRFSTLRSYLLNDMYVRKKIVAELKQGNVPFLNTAPIGRHWKRSSFREQGIGSAAKYESWARERGIPDEWLEEQARIDAECGLAFANVDHRKMVIVDGERAFIGSQNIADSYFYENELSPDPRVNVERWQWHDNSALLEGGAVRKLNRLFAERWALSGGELFDIDDAFYAPPPRRAGNAVVTVETSIPGMVRLPFRKNLPRALWSLLGGDARPFAEGKNPVRERVRRLPELAREDIYVEHCYPSDSALLGHWREIAAKVPNFTMVVPLHYDTKVLGMECDRLYPELSAAGVELFGYERAIMHSKIAVVDGWYVSTGSYNLTLRSGRADMELQFFIQCPDYGARVRERIRGDLTLCRPVIPGRLARYRSQRSVPVFDSVVRYLFL